MSTTPQASARPHVHTPVQLQGRQHIETQIECLAYSLLASVKSLNTLPITDEANCSVLKVRNQLSDLVVFVEDILKGGGT